ncbi:MAG: CBS domain-containing protein, partial [Hadesarchaea archaeon]|nr:CBS domain-containing protein [Hadesarchaea archaeon]
REKGVIAEKEIETPASEYMKKEITLIWEETPLNVAVEILSAAKARALPVINSDNKLAGMIGDVDIINVSEVETEEIKEQMRGKSESDSWTWDSEDQIYITKRSLKPSEKIVKDIMTKEALTITKRTSATKCANLLKENNIEQVPVTSGRKIIGIVRDEDLLKVFSE